MKYVINVISFAGAYSTLIREYGFYKNKSDAIAARDILINKIIFTNQAYYDNIFYTLTPSELRFDGKYELRFKDHVYLFEICETNYSTSCDDIDNSRICNEFIDAVRRCNQALASVMDFKRSVI